MMIGKDFQSVDGYRENPLTPALSHKGSGRVGSAGCNPPRLESPTIFRSVTMRKLTMFCIGMFAIMSFVATAARAELKVGDSAPDFELKCSDGNLHHLSDYKDKQAVVVAWFPKAFTGGCTAECKSMKENGDAIRKFDVVYFTASVDPTE